MICNQVKKTHDNQGHCNCLRRPAHTSQPPRWPQTQLIRTNNTRLFRQMLMESRQHIMGMKHCKKEQSTTVQHVHSSQKQSALLPEHEVHTTRIFTCRAALMIKRPDSGSDCHHALRRMSQARIQPSIWHPHTHDTPSQYTCMQAPLVKTIVAQSSQPN
jgi:hypothetical protein